MKLLIALTKGIMRDQHSRRHAMFVILVSALLMLFLGSTFLADWLMRRPAIFLLFWAACAWLTLTALLLAFVDMLLLRARHRRERRELRRNIFGENDPPHDL